MGSTINHKEQAEQEEDTTKMSREQFDAQAEKYAASEVHKSGASLPVLLAMAAPQSDDSVLDVATGMGNTAFSLAPHVSSVVGVDVSPKMLEEAKARAEREGIGNAAFLEGAAEQLPFVDSSFSMVVSRHAPHHFRDVPAFLREVHRVLKPGGRFVLADQITPNSGILDWVDYWQRTRDNSHFSQPTIEQWQEKAKDAGFRWAAERVVPYRLDFLWWTQQSGSSPQQVEALRQHAAGASQEIKEALGIEFDDEGQVQAHHEPILVARLERS